MTRLFFAVYGNCEVVSLMRGFKAPLGCVLLFSAVALATLSCVGGIQAQPPGQLKWDVISVKPMRTGSCRDGDGGVRFLPNGLSAACVPTVFAVEFAYHLMDPARILGLPKWTTGPQLYAIEARVSAEDAAGFAKLQRNEKAGMMQSILAERFGMKAHTEIREMPAYALVAAKSGSKLKESTGSIGGTSQFSGGTGEVRWINAPLTNLQFLLAEETGRPVVDKTGLTGKYDFNLSYLPTGAIDENGRPSIFTALKEQLGLELIPSKQPVEVLVVDSIEQPTEN